MREWPSHRAMVADLTKSGSHVLEQLTPRRVNMWHAATGIAGEAGEVLDVVKKWVIYNKVDMARLVEELGDLEYYLEQLRQEFGLERGTILRENMIKLGTRYAGGYSDQAAQARVDKQ